MEYIGGNSLRELVTRGPLGSKRLIPIAAQIASGLAHAHAAGVVHRDLKPDNVMIAKEGFAKILDFGVAKLLADDAPIGTHTATQPGRMIGTTPYMSPEQASGEHVDFRSDQFALGALLYEAATGKAAFARETPSQTVAAVLRDAPPALESLSDSLPPGLVRILRRCLEKDPAERYGATSDLAHDLADLERGVLPEPVRGSQPLRRYGIPIALALAVGRTGVVARARHACRTGAAGHRRAQLGDRDHSGRAALVWLLRAARVLPFPRWPPRRVLRVQGRQARAVPSRPARARIGRAARRRRCFQSRVLARRRMDRLPRAPEAQEDLRRRRWRDRARGGAKRARWPALGRGEPDSLLAHAERRDLGGERGRRRGTQAHRAQRRRGRGEPCLAVPRTWHEPAAVRRGDGNRRHVRWRADLRLGPEVRQAHAARRRRQRSERRRRCAVLRPCRARCTRRRWTSSAWRFRASPKPLYKGVTYSPATGAAQFSTAANARLFLRGAHGWDLFEPVVVSRDGKSESLGLEPAVYDRVRLSPDGRRAVFQITAADDDLWSYDFDRRVLARITNSGENIAPAWTPDGQYIVYCPPRDARAPAADACTSAAPTAAAKPSCCLPPGDGVRARLHIDVSPDGHSIAYGQYTADHNFDLWVFDTETGKDREWLSTPDAEITPRFSPDGRWIAYTAAGPDSDDVFIQSFQGEPRRWQVTTQGGRAPNWRRDGSELYFAQDNAYLGGGSAGR
jgi:hypothetical protein